MKITDSDLKMFQERARTELASGCDIESIAWDNVIWDLCNEIRSLRKNVGNVAALREAVHVVYNSLCDHEIIYSKERWRLIEIFDAALAAPPRNCDRFASAEQAWDAYDEWVDSYRSKGKTEPFNEFGWLFAPATEQEGGAK